MNGDTAHTTKKLVFVDPLETIWGFHVHQEVDAKDFGTALLTQQGCREYLEARGVKIDASDATHPGYGPHLNEMWELRVETHPDRLGTLQQLGAAVAFMATNRGPLPAYIHATMHDESLPVIEQLRQEGETNQANTIWFGQKIPQMQEFFFNPPLDKEGKVVDTRTPRVYTQAQLEAAKSGAMHPLAASGGVFVDPKHVLTGGFHLHLDYTPEQRDTAMHVFDAFVIYLLKHNMRFTSTRLYGERDNGPHLSAGWEVKFEMTNSDIVDRIGLAIGWLMCNRQGMNVFMHGVSWEDGDFDEELKAHEQYAFFIGAMPPMDLQFFVRLKEQSGAYHRKS
eukprot:GDKI01017580.1.p2 GENE.GDKI01017580.1~~GDKI01017580.1.p2  ORF type:complete len:351 (-),score=121.43 GDKI01017580.1:53-1063(-)